MRSARADEVSLPATQRDRATIANRVFELRTRQLRHSDFDHASTCCRSASRRRKRFGTLRRLPYPCPARHRRECSEDLLIT